MDKLSKLKQELILAIEAQLMDYMKVYNDDAKLPQSSFGDYDAKFLALWIYEAMQATEIDFMNREIMKDQETHVGEKYAD